VSIAPGSSSPGCEQTNSCYLPFEATVEVGGEVTWSNDDSAVHTVTSGTPQGGPSGVFNSGLLSAGATFSHAFRDGGAGTHDYHCQVHPWMRGRVRVIAAACP
jgi:plastocyanin